MEPRSHAPLFLIITSLNLLGSATAYDFDMVFQTKCIFEEVTFETTIAGHYSAFVRGHPDSLVPIKLRVEDPSGHVVLEKSEAAAADFDIPKVVEGEYKLCFMAQDYHAAQTARISLSWKEGVEATDWQQVAKRDHLDVIQTELLRLEESVHTIHLELQHIRRKEEEMRDINEATNMRVAYFSIGALVVCIFMAALQLWNLRRFFKRKKIL